MLAQDFCWFCRRVIVHVVTTVGETWGQWLRRIYVLSVALFIRGIPSSGIPRNPWTGRLTHRLIIPSRRAAASVPLTGLVHQAYLDWVNAQRFFAEVSDPDLVDEAVYLVNAAEKRYIYLLKQARKAEVGQRIPAGLT